MISHYQPPRRKPTRYHVTSVSLSEEEFLKLDMMAEEQDVTRTEVVRRLINKYFDEQ